MTGLLLETKLYIPRVRQQLVSRERLIQSLARTMQSRLTLVSAPAGFGKTTLLADWIVATPSAAASIAWLSLDEADNHPTVFWTYIVAALQRAATAIAIDADAYLQSAQPAAVHALVTALINALSGETKDIVLVLDDYHLISDREVQESIAFLLEHSPPCFHLVIASRADPALPLARLRARGELTELRAVDLRFNASETAAYLNEVMDLDLTAPDLDALEGRTEGWVAALHLAALSLQGRDDVSSFIQSFAGDNRYIVDYLVQEALQRQPDSVRGFLLKTALLDRLGAGLCDTITDREDSGAMLRYLEDANVFLVPLDDRRQWFRYHHLFADVLRARLASDQPGEIPELHRRASRWFEREGDLPQAIHHALAASDFESAASLIELANLDMLKARREDTLRAWLDRLPEEVVRLRPVLSVAYAGIFMHSGEFDSVEARLRDAEAHLATATYVDLRTAETPAGAVFVDEEQFRELPGMVALYRAGRAQIQGNLPDTVKYARLALDRMAEGAPLRGGVMALLGLALWSSGDLEAAYKTYSEGIARVHLGGYVNDSSTIMLADMCIAQGRLREALSMYRRSLQRAGEQGQAAPRGTADLHVGISEIYREQNDLDAAMKHLLRSTELGEIAGLPENRYRWFTAMAGMKQAEGNFDAALELLDQARRVYAGGFSPDVRPIAALKARVWIAQGRLTEAGAWARELALTPEDELTYLNEFDHVTLARLLLAHSTAGGDTGEILIEAQGLLARLLRAAEDGGRVGAVIEILVLQALGHRMQVNIPAALPRLERALELAEPEGYVHVFIDVGPSMTALLEAIAKRTDASYAHRLLASLRRPESPPGARQTAYESLSERELEVLRLLGGDLSGPDIARELVVSLNTVRTHTKSIYTKLAVNSRRAAVRRAEELRLL